MKTCSAFTLTALASTALAGPASAAITWTRSNTADENTLALYHFDESGTTAIDSSVPQNNATLTSDVHSAEVAGSWLNGGAGVYLQNTSGNFMTRTSISGLDYNKGLTVSFWYRVRDEAGSPSGGALFYSEGQSANGTLRGRMFSDTDTFGTGSNGRLRMQTSGGNTGLYSYGADHDWRHLAMVFDPAGSGGVGADDGGSWSFYIDNALQQTVVEPNDMTVAGLDTLRFTFMTDYYGITQGVHGRNADFDELFIQNGVITDFSNGYLASPIPEPASLALLGIGGMLLARRRRR